MSKISDSELSAVLGSAAKKGCALRFAVLGAGNGGLAMAGHLGVMGFPVRLYNRTDEKLAAVRWHGGIKVEGAVRGFGPVELATSDAAVAVEGADVIMVATPSTAHRSLAALVAPALRDGQVIVLNPGRTGGALEFRAALLDAGLAARPVIAEAQTFIYASRALSRHEAKIFQIKRGLALAALPSFRTPEVLAVLEPAFPEFKAGGSVLATSMENIGAVFHPALTILNAGWIEGTRGAFDYYLDGITPSVALVLERVDAERLAVARSLGVRSLSAVEWLYLSYGASGANLREAIKATAAYRGIRAPATVDHRYVNEDVPMSLVPMASIGAMLGVPTPSIDLVIDLASAMRGVDFRAIGRTVERLGIAGMSVKDIHLLVTEAGL